MLSARALMITWGGTPRYWSWIALPDSRFAEVAELLLVCWLHIHVKMESKTLSPATTYAVFLVYKLSDLSYGLGSAEASITYGNTVLEHKVCLEEKLAELDRPRHLFAVRRRDEEHNNVRYPEVREDGWMELELGEFYNDDDGENSEMEFSLMETKVLNGKKGLIIQGMEIRPRT